MKSYWKVLGITIGSLLGVLLLAVCIVVYVVFTPKRLTPFVRNAVDGYISCPYQIGEVDLTFFSTFPEFGLRIAGLYLINPMEGAPSDTLLAVPEVVAKVDVMKFLRKRELNIREISLKDAQGNIFINADRKSNMDVFVLSADTTEQDTSAFTLPFDDLQIRKIDLQAGQLSFISIPDSIEAKLYHTYLSLAADGFNDISLGLRSEEVTAVMGNTRYADGLRLQLNAPHTSLTLDTFGITLRQAELSVNEFILTTDGSINLIEDDILLDTHIAANQWDIPSLLRLLPADFTAMLEGIDLDAAIASLTADIKGVYSDNLMPLIDAHLLLTEGQAAYKEVFPYVLHDILLDADAHIDLNNEENSAVQLNHLHARTNKTTVDASGSIADILGDPLCNLHANADVNLPEFLYYLESDDKNTALQGRAKGTLNAAIRLSALSNMQLRKGVISGNINLTDFYAVYDSMEIDMPQGTLAFRIPNAKPSKPKADWLNATLTPTKLSFAMTDFLTADFDTPSFSIETSDILSSDPILYACIGLQAEHLKAETDSMGGALTRPHLQAYAEYDTQTTEAIPTLEASLDFADLQGFFSDMTAHLAQSDLTATVSGTRRDKTQPKAHLKLNTSSLTATMGKDIEAHTGHLSLTADARHNPSKENLLLQWNPRLSVSLTDGKASLASFAETIHIPQITFDYNNKIFRISESSLVVGNSDFSLTGEIRNIGKWIDKQGQLEGELAFTSQHTDVNELMALTSANSGTEETEEEAKAEMTETDKEANPFLVPKDVNLTLTTHIQEAVAFDQIMHNLGGRLYVQDGILVLEEMGFICNAAKLQLTAMYKTPRRNHIYAGIDYHMVDINIQELVNMIPQIDTMMPMLRSFRGNGEFHLAAETYLTATYDPKWSTARGAVSITGRDLVLLDSETFGQIAKILLFNRKTENLVDSISVQATLFKKEMDIYPFCMTMDKYMAAIGGQHNLDMSFNYHISLLRPLYIGVDVSGTFDDLKIKPAKCRYAQDFRPIIRKDVETQNATLKQLINNSLKRNVKIE